MRPKPEELLAAQTEFEAREAEVAVLRETLLSFQRRLPYPAGKIGHEIVAAQFNKMSAVFHYSVAYAKARKLVGKEIEGEMKTKIWNLAKNKSLGVVTLKVAQTR